MITSQSLTHIFKKETAICLALYEHIPAGGLDYRPTAQQRSTLELLRYLSFGPYNGTRRILAGDFSLGKPSAEVTRDWPPSDFVKNMVWQYREVARMLSSVREDDLMNKTITFPWGETLKRGEALVAHPWNWMMSYRMQLFLYLKACGAKELASPDLWHGRELAAHYARLDAAI